MATNVKPSYLNYVHYETTKYDDEIPRTIPGHEELHKHIEKIVQDYASKERVKVLELGVGTGLTAKRVLRKLPNTEYTAVDFSEQMLKGARQRLSQYNVIFINGDYSQIKLPKDNDLVVSVVGIHHQETDDDKRILFQRIYDSLNEAGTFIFGDLVTFRDPMEAAINEARHYHYLVEMAKNEASLKEWAHHHKFLNNLAPLEDQVKWLKEVGFREVDVVFQRYNTALIHAKK